MLNALTNVRFGGKADSDQPPLSNLDFWEGHPPNPAITHLSVGRVTFRERFIAELRASGKLRLWRTQFPHLSLMEV